MFAMALIDQPTHICLQSVADISLTRGYIHSMRHKKYVRAYPPLSDFSKLESSTQSRRLLWSLRWWLPLLVVLIFIMVSCGGSSGGTNTVANANAGPSTTPTSPSVNPTPSTPPNSTPSGPSGTTSTTTTTPGSTNTTAPPQPAGALVVTEITAGLASPWGMAFLPGGSALVTERAGTLRIVSPAGTVSAAITGVPLVDSRGQGGLLDVVLDPAFANNQRIYLSFAKPSANAADGNSTAVARAVLNPATLALGQVTVIFEQLPKAASTGHFGSRLVFDNNGYLFVTLGDRQNNDQRAFA